VVSSIAYPNLLRTKRLGCGCGNEAKDLVMAFSHAIVITI
jgi:hypothetical protein